MLEKYLQRLLGPTITILILNAFQRFFRLAIPVGIVAGFWVFFPEFPIFELLEAIPKLLK